MAKTTRKTRVPARPTTAAGGATTPQEPPAEAAPKSLKPQRTLAGVIVGIVAQRLLAAAARRLIRRLR